MGGNHSAENSYSEANGDKVKKYGLIREEQNHIVYFLNASLFCETTEKWYAYHRKVHKVSASVNMV